MSRRVFSTVLIVGLVVLVPSDFVLGRGFGDGDFTSADLRLALALGHYQA